MFLVSATDGSVSGDTFLNVNNTPKVISKNTHCRVNLICAVCLNTIEISTYSERAKHYI